MTDALILPTTVETLSGAIAWWAERTPQAPALQMLGCSPLTYAALDRRVRYGIGALRGLGIGQEERIALVVGDGIDATAALLTAMSGAVAVPLSPLLSPAEFSRDLGRLGATVLIAEPRAATAALVAAGSLGLPVVPVERILAWGPARTSRPASDPDPDPDPAAVMLIAHTSGTTADPKRVPITHRMQLAAARARNRRRGIGSADAGLLLAPSASVMFLTNLITMLIAGGSAIVVPQLDPIAALRANAALQPTWMLAGLPLYSAMLQCHDRQPALFRNPRLRLVNWGGAGAAPDLADRLTHAFEAPSDGNYGMSEASAIATPAAPGSAKPGSVGAAAAAEIRIIDDAGEPCGVGAVGAVVVRGPSVFAGYLDEPAATAAAFLPGGWFRTGDLGYLDADGDLFLTGRAGEQINRGGVKIAPAEIEQVLLAHPAVLDAAVFAVADPALGEDVIAAVVPRPGHELAPRQVRAWMLDRLALPKTPRRLWIVPAIPRTATGKVQRGELQRRWRGSQE